MSIADEPDMSPAQFWGRLDELFGSTFAGSRYIHTVPGAPMVLTLEDGRQFVGSSLREIIAQVEEHGARV